MNDQQESQTEPSSDQVEVCLEATEQSVPSSEELPVIMIEDAVVAAAAEHGQQNTSCEQAGVLVGTVTTGQDRAVVCVEAAVPAAHTEASRSRVTFTHDSWNQIYQVIDSQYPDKQIVGWYHTHPGFGIFLSEYDLFIHRNFFNAPWQIAYVIDPLSQESGCFGWKGGNIARTASYNIYSPARAGQLPVAETLAAPRPSRGVAARQLSPVSAGILLALGVILALQLAGLLLSAKRSTLALKSAAEWPATVRIEPAAEQLAEQDISLEEINKELALLRKELGIAYQWYTVEPGDSLWKIARDAYGRGDMAGLIAAENGLDPAEPALEPGMRLRIPKLPEKPDESASSGQ